MTAQLIELGLDAAVIEGPHELGQARRLHAGNHRLHRRRELQAGQKLRATLGFGQSQQLHLQGLELDHIAHAPTGVEVAQCGQQGLADQADAGSRRGRVNGLCRHRRCGRHG